MPAPQNRSSNAPRSPASTKAAATVPPNQGSFASRVFPGVFGGFLGITLLKFGNPPITEKWVSAPTNGYEFVLGYPWPMSWALALLGIALVVGFLVVKLQPVAPRWLLVLPLVWFAWQIVSATQTLDAELTKLTLRQFFGCIICFYLGCFALARSPRLRWFWVGLLTGLVLVIIVGCEQHFGGLEATRRYFFLYIYPTMKDIPPGYLKKMSGTRIFSTLFYPNALAGVLLLLTPVMIGVIRNLRRYFTRPALLFLQLLAAGSCLACLYWSGSKGGWLLALFVGAVSLLQSRLAKAVKLTVVAVLLVAGVAGFFWKYASFFTKGATSVSARMDYWHAAAATAKKNPILGTGPGTFFIPYMAIKRPESEPARLVHNDYLEQASDSGLPGFLAYAGFIVAALSWSFRSTHLMRSQPTPEGAVLVFAVWLGLLGWALQGLIEFGLYIPGSAWPAFSLLGWIIGGQGRFLLTQGSQPEVGRDSISRSASRKQ